MKHPQVLNINTDSASDDNQIAIDGLNVINNTTEAQMSASVSSITIDISIWDLMTGATAGTVSSKTMTYESGPDIWTIDVSDIMADVTLVDKHKYIANVTENGGSTMRPFKISEFAVDNDSFEDTWMTLPYQVEIGATSKIIWYTDTGWGTPKYEAYAYEGGTGTTYATNASRVTHRGPITAV